jgi:ABC-2 type transport system ATP-binding protein
MRRRLDLASSMLTRPRVLFLDEPTTGLDPRSRNEIWDIVRDLRREGTTILLTTQYLKKRISSRTRLLSSITAA